MLTRPVMIAAALCAFFPLSANSQQPRASIEAEPLRELDAWSVSALTRAEGALSADLWNHSDAGFLALVLQRLPAVYNSPAAQALALRVLLSGGEAPSGEASAAARARFEALGKMGAAEPLAMLAAGAGTALNDPAIAQYAAQAELARGRRAEACARGRGAEMGERAPPFLLRLRAYCAGTDRAAADLALELARAAGADDAWYTGAIAALGGAPGPRPPAARFENSLTTQISLAARLIPGPNPLTSTTSTFSLVALALSEQARQPLRAQAAVLAFRRGALSVTEARTICSRRQPISAPACRRSWPCCAMPQPRPARWKPRPPSPVRCAAPARSPTSPPPQPC